MHVKKALITGITGQDGSYLAELLLSKGYGVHGLIRRASTFNTGRIDHIYTDPHIPRTKLFLHYGDLSDSGQLTNLIYNIQPDEIYHLGAQSHVRVSFDMPEYTGDITALGTIRILEAIRRSGAKAKFYQASSSEMFGATRPPQNEGSPFYPRSPYAAAKVYSYWMTVNYREGYNLFLRLREYKKNELLFLHDKRVPTNNSLCERLARVYKRKQKQVMVMRSFDNLGYLCNSMSVVYLLRNTEDNMYEKISSIFKRKQVGRKNKNKNKKPTGVI